MCNFEPPTEEFFHRAVLSRALYPTIIEIEQVGRAAQTHGPFEIIRGVPFPQKRVLLVRVTRVVGHVVLVASGRVVGGAEIIGRSIREQSVFPQIRLDEFAAVLRAGRRQLDLLHLRQHTVPRIFLGPFVKRVQTVAFLVRHDIRQREQLLQRLRYSPPVPPPAANVRIFLLAFFPLPLLPPLAIAQRLP